MHTDKPQAENRQRQRLAPEFGGPLAVLRNPKLRSNLEALERAPWDCITGPEFAEAGGFSPRKMPDWRRSVTYMHLPDTEHKRLFAGPADHYRLDVLFDWIDSDGRRETEREILWPLAAEHLQKHGLGRPDNALETDERLNWLWSNGLLLPRITPLIRPYFPYSNIAR